MLEHGRISVRQLMVLVFLTQIGDMILVYPAVITYYSHQDAWLASLLGIPFGLLTVWLMLRMYQLMPGLTLIEALNVIFGKWLGGGLSVWYLFYFLVLSAIATREVGDFLTTQILPETPLRVVTLLFVIVLLWGVAYGIESLGRTGEMVLPLVVLFILLLVVCILPQAELSRLMPVFGSGAKSIASGTALAFAYPFGELVALLMLLPYATNRPHRSRDLLVTTMLGGLLLSSIVMISLMVMGPFFTKHNIYASFILSQRISIGNFLERIEAVMATIWIVSTYFKGAVYFYCFVLGSAQLFKLRSYRLLILPATMIVFGMASIIAPNITYYVSMIVNYWLDWDITCSLVIPLLALLVYHIRQKWGGTLKGASEPSRSEGAGAKR